MESALYGIYALVVFVSEILLVRCAHSFDFWYVNNSCVNTVRQHFPWSILYIPHRFYYKLSISWIQWNSVLKNENTCIETLNHPELFIDHCYYSTDAILRLIIFLQWDYCNWGYLDKVDQWDYRKITIRSKKVGCGPISSS